MMAFKRSRTAPSPYNKLLFHGFRILQALSSLVVAAVMSYFIPTMRQEGYIAPKTFYLLLTSSLVTLLVLIASFVVYLFSGLSPRINLLGNSLLLILWTPGFILLWYYSAATLSHVCDRTNWNGPVGISVCRTYKALFAFATLGTVSTIAGFVLDIATWRRTTARGKYAAAHGSGDTRPLGINAGLEPYVAREYSDSRSSMALEHEQYIMRETTRDSSDGYAVPEEQFAYDQTDTAYHGGHQPQPVTK